MDVKYNPNKKKLQIIKLGLPVNLHLHLLLEKWWSPLNFSNSIKFNPKPIYNYSSKPIYKRSYKIGITVRILFTKDLIK